MTRDFFNSLLAIICRCAFVIVAAEAVGLIRAHERPCFSGIRDAMMGRLMPGLVRGGAVRGKSKQRDGENKAERRRSFDQNVHLDLPSVQGVLCREFLFSASPYSTIRVQLADVLVMRSRRRAVYSVVAGII